MTDATVTLTAESLVLYDEAVQAIHRAFCDPDHELVGEWDRYMADALRRRGLVIVEAAAATAPSPSSALPTIVPTGAGWTDGTDVSAKLQTLIDDSGGHLIFPAGFTWTITQPLLFPASGRVTMTGGRVSVEPPPDATEPGGRAMSEPRTAAGRDLLSWVPNAYAPITREFLHDRIHAIEEEAVAQQPPLTVERLAAALHAECEAEGFIGHDSSVRSHTLRAQQIIAALEAGQ